MLSAVWLYMEIYVTTIGERGFVVHFEDCAGNLVAVHCCNG